MGLIRKTLSISTLGLVSWKSKKERLAQTEEELARARAELGAASQRSSTLEEHLSKTRSKLDDTELSALRDARKAHRKGLWKGRLQRRKGALATARELAAPLVDSATDAGSRVAGDAEPVVDEIRSRGRRSGRKAQKKADEARDRAEERASQLRSRAESRAHDLRTSAERRADELRYRATGRSKRFGTPFRVFGRRASKRARSPRWTGPGPRRGAAGRRHPHVGVGPARRD